ncbi:MAG: glycosyltransferase [Chthoniobacteraceae bacterium]
MKISAFIPCYNNGLGIERTIASIRNQSVPVDEFFVVDDHSADDSVKISSSLGVRVVQMPRNMGRGAVRARAVAEAAHDLLLCCDAGKEIGPEFVKNALPWFEDMRVPAVFGPVIQPSPVNAVERWRGRHLFKAWTDIILHDAALVTAGSLLRVSAMKDVGNFSEQLREGEDQDLGVRLLASGYDVICDPKLIVVSSEANTVFKVLERYWRWNTAPHGRMSAWNYLRQILFSIKVMARDDLRAGDPAAALISLLSPHYQFWIPLITRHRP